MTRQGAQLCREMLARNHLLAKTLGSPDFPLETFHMLQAWQRHRLADTYMDLMEQENTRPACEFFLSDLYGGLDFLERDQEMDRVMPVMAKFLPGHALISLAAAFELQAMSLEFDIEMVRILETAAVTKLDLGTYASTYRRCGMRAERERQILLIQNICIDLAQLVDKPLVTNLVRLLRGPAHAAGFGKLQEFLESGLMSFRQLEDRAQFSETIYQREWLAMQRLFAGDENPYRP